MNTVMNASTASCSSRPSNAHLGGPSHLFRGGISRRRARVTDSQGCLFTFFTTGAGAGCSAKYISKAKERRTRDKATTRPRSWSGFYVDLGGISPERKGAGLMKNLLTACAVKIVLCKSVARPQRTICERLMIGRDFFLFVHLCRQMDASFPFVRSFVRSYQMS